MEPTCRTINFAFSKPESPKWSNNAVDEIERSYCVSPLDVLSCVVSCLEAPQQLTYALQDVIETVHDDCAETNRQLGLEDIHRVETLYEELFIEAHDSLADYRDYLSSFGEIEEVDEVKLVGDDSVLVTVTFLPRRVV